MSFPFYGSDGTTGTVAVTNGSKSVTGSGTAWLSNAAVPTGGGYCIKLPDGLLYGIASCTGEGALTLVDNYIGSSASAQPYYIVPCAASMAALLNAVSTLLNSSNFSQLAGLIPNSGDFIEYLGGVWTNRSPIQTLLNLLNSLTEVSVASATTCDIGAALSPKIQITGTTTITGFGTQINALRLVRFAGALTLTHNATSLILPGGANLTTAAGDMALVTSDASGNWRVREYVCAGAPVRGQPEATIASASTVDLGSVNTDRVAVSGTTTITSFGTRANQIKSVRFADALTLTHNATSLILLGGAGRTTAAGDVGIYTSDSSGNWRERDYCRAASDPGDMATKSGTQTLANKTLASPTVTGTFTSAGISDAATATVLSLGSSNTAGIGVAPTSNKGLAVGDFGASNNNFYVNTINTAAIFVPGGLTGATGENAGNAVFKVRKDSTTGRSINSAGTNNAAGADYADYYFKRDDCGPILKGQGVGFDCAGLVTDKWANAVSFGVKSTAPSYVGGDIWGTPETLGLEEPQAPEPPDDGADDATVASYNTAKAQYATDKSAFDAALEAQRQKVDRIAVAGKVPVIVSESCNPGDWIVPAQDGEGIKLIAVADSAVTFDQYRKCVGRVLVASPTETQLRILVPPDIALIAGWNAIVDVMKG
jgi:hypothetical protein